MKQLTSDVIEWTKDYFNKYNVKKAVVGISGGKDSSVVADICVQALGKKNVIGVEMPNGVQSDIDCSERLIEHLGITKRIVNIKGAYDAIISEMVNYQNFLAQDKSNHLSSDCLINLPARLRMSVLYAIGQNEGAFVMNTCNLSENAVGYATLFGDSAGSVAPIDMLTTDEIIDIGDDLGLPYALTHKVPTDGLCGKTDEDKLGFTYREVNELIRKGIKGEHYEQIKKMYEANKFKMQIIQIPHFDPKLPNHLFVAN